MVKEWNKITLKQLNTLKRQPHKIPKPQYIIWHYATKMDME